MTLSSQAKAPALASNNIPSPDHAIHISENIWWVGHYQEDDPFKCHVYLLENGDHSILFDPGSNVTFKHTLKKIQEVIDFSDIRYFVCHHQDPDITSCLPQIDDLVTREDACIVTHAQTQRQLRHFGLKMPFWLVEENGWHLELEGRSLDFIFTPYAHFPAAFCSFEQQSGGLFSSDIFSGHMDGFGLIAKDETCFEAMRSFHETYISTREVLDQVVDKVEKLPLNFIAPQQGAVIPLRLIDCVLQKMRTLECGQFLFGQETSDLDRLTQLNSVVREMIQTMITCRDFSSIVMTLMEIVGRVLPVCSMDFYAQMQQGEVLYLGHQNRYRGSWALPKEEVTRILQTNRYQWEKQKGGPFEVMEGNSANEPQNIVVPLFPSHGGAATSAVVIQLEVGTVIRPDINVIISEMSLPLSVAMEREIIHRTLDLEKNRIFERSVRDPLTGLYNRSQLFDTVSRMISAHDRDENVSLGVIMIDIDHFKGFNDKYGHNQGDLVLTTVAKFILDTIRQNDFPVRMGGEEFAIFIVGDSIDNIKSLSERLREGVAQIVFNKPVKMHNVTISLGTAVHQQKETMDQLINRADATLYEAKNSGRNQICHSV